MNQFWVVLGFSEPTFQSISFVLVCVSGGGGGGNDGGNQKLDL